MNREVAVEDLLAFDLAVHLACLLATGLTLGVIGGGSRSRFFRHPVTPGPPWLRFGYLYLVGGIFVFFLLRSFWNALKWGKESQEYADLLKEEEAEETSRRKDVSE
jgi:hypothetical protein